ncbi:MAG: hypothetical protein WBA97_33190 [Actinophytocola sp.]|uniref:hypothetical protein n=1 Tax=Actinophytocola sp. TaxID=1872138 RepID=UPI003C74FE57
MSRSDEDLNKSEAEPTEAETTGTEKSGTEKSEPATGRRTVTLVSVVAVVVLVVAGVVVFLLTNGDDSSDAAQDGNVPTITGSPAPTTPEPTEGASVAPPATATGATGPVGAPVEAGPVAEQAAAAISSSDIDALNQLACDPSNPAAEETFPADAKATVVGEPKITGDTATVDLKLTIGDSEPAVVPMPLTKKDGRWCIPS